MAMALCFFPLMMFFLFLAALHMPLAVILGDHCPIAEDMIFEALSGKNMSLQEFQDLEIDI